MIPRTYSLRFLMLFYNDFATQKWKHSKDLFGSPKMYTMYLQRWHLCGRERVIWWSWCWHFPRGMLDVLASSEHTQNPPNIFCDVLKYLLLFYDMPQNRNALASFGWILKFDMIACMYTNEQQENMSFRNMNPHPLPLPLKWKDKDQGCKWVWVWNFEAMCLSVRMCEVSEMLILWPSRILEISVAGRRVQVKAESTLVDDHVVRHSLKEPSLQEAGLHWNALVNILQRERQGRGNLPGIWQDSAWLQPGLFSHEHHIHPNL